MPGFVRALELGADALEMDLHMTSDGVIVVSHDPDGERLAGVPVAIRKAQLDEVRRWDLGRHFVTRAGDHLRGRGYRIPTFEEVLAAFPNVPINVDVKQHKPSMVEPLLALIARYGAEERVLIASFDAGTLADVRRRGYRGQTGLAQSEVIALLLLPRSVLAARPRRGDAAQLPTHIGGISLARPAIVEKCHALGLRLDYWTVNDADEARTLWELGADGVMTDDVAAVEPAYREFRRPTLS